MVLLERRGAEEEVSLRRQRPGELGEEAIHGEVQGRSTERISTEDSVSQAEVGFRRVRRAPLSQSGAGEGSVDAVLGQSGIVEQASQSPLQASNFRSARSARTERHRATA